MIASPLKSLDLPEDRILIFKRDVTLEKEYQAKYYQAEKLATVGTLATGVAHEINNPLMAISGYAEGIQRKVAKLKGKLPEPLVKDFEEYTKTIHKECHRCQEIVQGLLTFGHPKSSVCGIVNLNTVIRETIKLLGYHLKQVKNMTLSVDLDESLPIINANEPQLKQVILNLLTNATDSLAEQQGTISIRSYLMNEDKIVFEVADTGCGISPDIHDRLFDPFFTTKPVGKGIGIGLSTCYNIVKEHHGEIRVMSEVGLGSRFIVILPTRQG